VRNRRDGSHYHCVDYEAKLAAKRRRYMVDARESICRAKL
jgi:hypothetical protein